MPFTQKSGHTLIIGEITFCSNSMSLNERLLPLSRYINAGIEASHIVTDIRTEASPGIKEFSDNPMTQWYLPFSFLDQKICELPEAEKNNFCNQLALFFLHTDDLLCTKYHYLQGNLNYKYSYQILEYYFALNSVYEPVPSKEELCNRAINELFKSKDGEIKYLGPTVPEQDIELLNAVNVNKSLCGDPECFMLLNDQTENLNILSQTTISRFYSVLKEYLRAKHEFHVQLASNRQIIMDSVIKKAKEDETFGFMAYQCLKQENYTFEASRLYETFKPGVLLDY